MSQYDNIRSLIKTAESKIAEFGDQKTGIPENDIVHNNLMKGFKSWIHTIQVDLVNGEVDKYETPELNAITRLESLIKALDIVLNISKLNNDEQINEYSLKSLLKQSIIDEYFS